MDVKGRATNASDTDGEVAWSWPPDAEVKPCRMMRGDGGKKARSPGRSRISC